VTHPETERYYTPKLSLLAPSIDDEISSCRPSWERLDEAYSGAIVVSPGTMPDESILFDGALVAERTTGIIWRAQRNAAGVFEKRYVKYPWSISLAQGSLAFNNVSAGNWVPWGYQVYEGGSINSASSDLVNNRLVIPITGIYVGRDKISWQGTPTSTHYGHTLWKNDALGTGPLYNDWYESTWPPSVDSGDLSSTIPINEKFYKGDTICAGLWQSSGGNVTNSHRIQLALLRVVD
jgi:hypothetical protein